MNTGLVMAENFPTKYSIAFYPQYTIGCDNFFCRKISQEWLLLFDYSKKNRYKTQQYSTQYIQGANIVKIILHNIIIHEISLISRFTGRLLIANAASYGRLPYYQIQ